MAEVKWYGKLLSFSSSKGKIDKTHEKNNKDLKRTINYCIKLVSRGPCEVLKAEARVLTGRQRIDEVENYFHRQH